MLKKLKFCLKILNLFIWFINWFRFDSYYYYESPIGPIGSYYKYHKDLKYF